MSVVIPYRGDDGGHRDRALAWVLRWWEAQHPAWQVVIGYCPPGPWCKGAALADGLAELDSTDGVVVVADADMITDGVGDAVAQVQACGGWAVPHRLLHRLTETATARLMASHPAGITRPPDTSTVEAPYEGFAGGSMTVLARALIDDVPIDRRFHGWGQQDEAWAVDLDAIAGPAWRGTADIWHLWHPPQQRESRRWGSPMNRALLREHLVARQRGETRALLAEIRNGP